jgi:hypothetical protein
MRELFEFYGLLHFEDFSDVCNDTGIYLILFFIILGISIFSNFLFYIIIDSSIYNQNKFYYTYLILFAIFTSIISYFFIQYRISLENFNFSKLGFISLSIITFFYFSLFFLIGSILLKNFSKNSYRTPF